MTFQHDVWNAFRLDLVDGAPSIAPRRNSACCVVSQESSQSHSVHRMPGFGGLKSFPASQWPKDSFRSTLHLNSVPNLDTFLQKHYYECRFFWPPVGRLSMPDATRTRWTEVAPIPIILAIRLCPRPLSYSDIISFERSLITLTVPRDRLNTLMFHTFSGFVVLHHFSRRLPPSGWCLGSTGFASCGPISTCPSKSMPG